jgi:hypothetical protein
MLRQTMKGKILAEQFGPLSVNRDNPSRKHSKRWKTRRPISPPVPHAGISPLRWPQVWMERSPPLSYTAVCGSGDMLPITNLRRLTGAFAVENNRAVIAMQTITRENIGTDANPTCGSPGPGPGNTARPAFACIYDGHTQTMTTTEVGELSFVEAAIDSEGNAAIVCPGALIPPASSCVLFYGEWKSDGGATPDAPVVSSFAFEKGPPKKKSRSPGQSFATASMPWSDPPT